MICMYTSPLDEVAAESGTFILKHVLLIGHCLFTGDIPKATLPVIPVLDSGLSHLEHQNMLRVELTKGNEQFKPEVLHIWLPALQKGFKQRGYGMTSRLRSAILSE